MDINTIIIDNFLDNPDIVRSSVMQIDFTRVGQYPGLRSDRADYDYEEYVKSKIENILNKKIKEFKLDSFAFQLCLEEDSTWIHMDHDAEWAGVLYLQPTAPIAAGTGIFRHKESKIYRGPSDHAATNDDDWELITLVGNVYNRLVLYQAPLYHRSLVAGFGNDKETGRLTQVFFFDLDDK
jgi:hypothetical protein